MLFFLFFALFSQAAEPTPVSVSQNLPPYAIVTKVKGEARFEGRRLNIGYRIDYPGHVTTKADSFLQLTIAKWNKKVNIGPVSKLKVDFKSEAVYSLESGVSRWLKDKKNDVPGAPKGII